MSLVANRECVWCVNQGCASPTIPNLHRPVKDSYTPTLSKLIQVTEEQIQLVEQTQDEISEEEPQGPSDGVGFTSVTLMASAQRVDMDSKVALAIRWVFPYMKHCCPHSWFNR